MNKIILKIVLLFLIAPSLAVAQLKSVDYWELAFIKKSEQNYKKSKKLSTSADSRQFYDLAYYIDANVAMYKATKRTIYLDQAVGYVKDMINEAKLSSNLSKSQYKDGFYGWANFTAPKEKNYGKEIPLYESYCWRYVSDLLYIIKKEKLNEDKAFKEDYDQIYNFTVENIYNKWLSRGKENLYRSNTHMMSHWVKISMNLYLLTGDEKYKIIIDDFLNKFRNNQKIYISKAVSATVKWKSDWRNKNNNFQDISHGNAVIDVMIALYDNNLGVSKTEIDQLIILFDKVIWKSKSSFAKYVDGSGKGSGWFTDGFIKLGRYNADLQRRIESHNKGRSVQFFANGALNVEILKDQNGLN